MQRLIKFLRDVGREMKKVSWPKKKELTKYTITVIVTVTFMSLFFTVLDMGLSALIRLILG